MAYHKIKHELALPDNNHIRSVNSQVTTSIPRSISYGATNVYDSFINFITEIHEHLMKKHTIKPHFHQNTPGFGLSSEIVPGLYPRVIRYLEKKASEFVGSGLNIEIPADENQEDNFLERRVYDSAMNSTGVL